MKVIGIIVEYNPLQNGHEYQLHIAKEKYGADCVLLVMTGNFNERGLPAIMPKTTRAKHAIDCGADVVIELPVCYSISDLPLFSLAAVKLLDSLGVVDNVLFGSETGNIDEIEDIAAIMKTEQYNELYSESLEKRNFDKRVDVLKRMGYPEYAEYVNQPNNLLGINYVQALKDIGSDIIPLTHKRIGQAYMDSNIIINKDEKIFSSASAIRKSLNDALVTNSDFPQFLEKCLPEKIFEWMKENWKLTFPLLSTDFWNLIKQVIQNATVDELSCIDGMCEDIAIYMKENLTDDTVYEVFREDFKNDIINVNLNRRLFRILTKQKKSDLDSYIKNGVVFYARILATSKKSKHIMNAIKSKSEIPVFDYFEMVEHNLSNPAKQQLMNDVEADRIYNCVYRSKFGVQGSGDNEEC